MIRRRKRFAFDLGGAARGGRGDSVCFCDGNGWYWSVQWNCLAASLKMVRYREIGGFWIRFDVVLSGVTLPVSGIKLWSDFGLDVLDFGDFIFWRAMLRF